MKLEPKNRRLLLEKIKSNQPEIQSTFILPERKKLNSEENEIFRVLDRSEDCTLSVSVGSLVLIEGNMVEQAKVNDSVLYFCKENFVIGVLKE